MTQRLDWNRREVVAGAGAALALGSPAFAAPRLRPNIVVIVVDDMRFDEYGAGGHTFLRTPAIDALGASGATFANAYHTTPLCSPNRASILTGQFASTHGIIDNTSRAHASHRLHTFAQELQRAGYETAHIGKWHMGNDPRPRPGYDTWVSFEGQGRTINPELYEDGRAHIADGYITDVLTDRTLAFATRRRRKPFMVFLSHKAIHPDVAQRDDGTVDVSGGQHFIPAPRHRGRYAGQIFRRRANYGFGKEVRDNQPVLADAIDERNAPETVKAFGAQVLDGLVSDETIQARAEMMLAVDEGLGRLVAALEEAHLRENTLILFMSDNGYFFGEHGLSLERRLPYEESIKSPLLVSYPAAVAPGLTIAPFVLSVDIAPTLVAAAGAPVPARMQGRSFLPLLRGEVPPWRDSFLVEYYSHENPFPWTANLGYRAVRMGSYKLVRWISQDGAEEFYDLATDPFERRNLARDPAQAQALAAVRERMAALVVQSLGLPSAARL